jgi:AraC-like DNA-binding protein
MQLNGQYLSTMMNANYVSDRRMGMIRRRKYLNYTTPWGVDLTRTATAGWSAFLIHESGYQPFLEDWNHEGVDSPFWRFYYNPKPGCYLRFRGRKIPLEPKSCVLIPADTVFDCVGPVKACHFWAHFTVSRPGVAIAPEPIVIAMNEMLGVLSKSVIATHCETASHARNHRLHHQTAAMLHAAFVMIDEGKRSSMPENLIEVLALIHRAPHSRLSNRLLAARAGLNVEKFIRAFREHTGQTPAAYVIATRLRAAQEALALTDKSVDQIASECGFANRHYFSRMFARGVGCGPAEFRLRQWKKKGR